MDGRLEGANSFGVIYSVFENLGRTVYTVRGTWWGGGQSRFYSVVAVVNARPKSGYRTPVTINIDDRTPRDRYGTICSGLNTDADDDNGRPPYDKPGLDTDPLSSIVVWTRPPFDGHNNGHYCYNRHTIILRLIILIILIIYIYIFQVFDIRSRTGNLLLYRRPD